MAIDGLLSGGAANFTPWGAGASLAAEAISTPNTSAATAGDFIGGSNTFGVGVQTGGSSGTLPTWFFIGALALGLLYILRRK